MPWKFRSIAFCYLQVKLQVVACVSVCIVDTHLAELRERFQELWTYTVINFLKDMISNFIILNHGSEHFNMVTKFLLVIILNFRDIQLLYFVWLLILSVQSCIIQYSLQWPVPFETMGAMWATQNSGYMQESTRNVSRWFHCEQYGFLSNEKKHSIANLWEYQFSWSGINWRKQLKILVFPHLLLQTLEGHRCHFWLCSCRISSG